MYQSVDWAQYCPVMGAALVHEKTEFKNERAFYQMSVETSSTNRNAIVAGHKKFYLHLRQQIILGVFH